MEDFIERRAHILFYLRWLWRILLRSVWHTRATRVAFAFFCLVFLQYLEHILGGCSCGDTYCYSWRLSHRVRRTSSLRFELQRISQKNCCSSRFSEPNAELERTRTVLKFER
jgi:hypothetical protein